ncbi:hypothetical protein J1614_009609 [Plenodomus biglobosus]|nr:hypothetical protein J1614_009609 [Plenodomus biglobosus]
MMPELPEPIGEGQLKLIATSFSPYQTLHTLQRQAGGKCYSNQPRRHKEHQHLISGDSLVSLLAGPCTGEATSPVLTGGQRHVQVPEP